MAWRNGGSLTRSLVSAARAPRPSLLRSAPPHPARIRPPSSSRRLAFSPSRNLGELGCMQSFLPLQSMVAKSQLTSHLNANLRAFCELSHGTFCRSCQDR